MPRNDNGQILIWNNDTTNPTSTFPAYPSYVRSVFVTADDQIFVGNGGIKGQVDRWTLNGSRLPSSIFLCAPCKGLFVDVKNNLYCSTYELHQVVRQSLSDPSSEMTITAGTGCAGSTAQMLNYPMGIFVTITLDLYVADHRNDRIQLFRWGQRNGETVAGSGSSGTIKLNRPTIVFVDGDGYLFIVDTGSSRIVRSTPDGFRCVVGCSGSGGAGSNELNWPRAISFDIDGNLFVADQNNHRIQKFFFISDSCGKSKISREEECSYSTSIEMRFESEEKEIQSVRLSSSTRRFLSREVSKVEKNFLQRFTWNCRDDGVVDLFVSKSKQCESGVRCVAIDGD